MLFFFMVINFASKTVLGLAAVPIMHELHISHTAFGTLSASFFYLFSLSALVIGFAVNRIRTTLVIQLMAIVWALCQLAALGAAGIGVLMASRMALGVGEGPAYPVGMHAIYKWFPDARRTLPAAIISQGSSFGVVVALPGLNWLLLVYSWRVAFGVLGVMALVWAVLWALVGREGPLDDPEQTEADMPATLPYRALLTEPTLLSAWLAGFGGYWGVALLVSWFTPYCVEGLGFSQAAAGWLSTTPWAASIVIAITGGWISEWLLARGFSSRIARGVFGGGMIMAGGAALLIVPLVHAPVPAFILLVLGLSLPSVIYSFQPAIAAELAPRSQRGGILAIGTAIWSLSGVVAPAVMGHLIDAGAGAVQGYGEGFEVAGVVALAAGLVGVVFMNPEKARIRLQACDASAATVRLAEVR